ncbi:ester cyclase [Nonomuraea sp. NPDC049695]|uniref:ester cyclase n=1 Tax=Nonomuraea sp. NPDC049695 TaxID=3154734 RepID=UPI0034170DE3
MSEELTPAAVVRAHSKAKTSGDIAGALSWCREDVVFETVAFQTAAHGIDESRRQFQGFLGAFPDYSVQLEDLREMDDLVLGVGRITGTMKGPLAGIEPTGRAFDLPFVCLWYVQEGLITLERFFYDFNEMCEQLGIDTTTAANRFRAWRERTGAAASR